MKLLLEALRTLFWEVSVDGTDGPNSESDHLAIWGPDEVVGLTGQRDEFVRLESIAIRKE